MVQLAHTPPPSSRPARKPGSDEPLILPFRIIADNRERSGGWQFRGLTGDSGDKYRPLVVPLEYRHLVTADYTIEGVPCFIERKSQDDFIATITHGRENFEKEHDRMRDLIAAGGSCCVIIEADYEATMQYLDSGLSGRNIPGGVVRGSAAAEINDHGIPWVWASNRRCAEELAFSVLRKAWERSQKR